ncbi:hypothetical protein [Jeotgalibacillus aurantiacus]|uniref:hypothetical protein n=1 Tax=Jeotgalibacillus aurantiacus TaxID=2763266 RepID=UPI001D0B9113|nr:hypothetical protein [Jeotgalibacillus aurantiacus]
MSSRWSDVIDLISIDEENEVINENGYPVPAETRRENIFCNKKDVRSAEFYQAAAQNIRLEMMLEMHSVDYQGEEYLFFHRDQSRYFIERTYDRGEKIELVCRKDGDRHAG